VANDLNDPVTIKLPVILALPVYGNTGVYVEAKDELKACVAYEAVPNKDPVIPLVTIKDPVITELFCAMRPLRAVNSFAIFF
jgi:hypothetical protein